MRRGAFSFRLERHCFSDELMKPWDADHPLAPVVFCIGDMGAGKAFYIRADIWFGGTNQVLERGRVPYQLKMRCRDLFFINHGRVPDAGLQLAQFSVESLSF
ncbi:hypothetical protein B1806_00735 [Metallibacterium scheffleri]|uniref:Uncharacterized protein n=2 Tax=Metallibacterium scheffleri TaxID=993689 RepID=A0A4S3KSL9_9GAMM|nr:hypothetical protein B1806_00735 [Metallibacterium scheffleri]